MSSADGVDDDVRGVALGSLTAWIRSKERFPSLRLSVDVARRLPVTPADAEAFAELLAKPVWDEEDTTCYALYRAHTDGRLLWRAPRHAQEHAQERPPVDIEGVYFRLLRNSADELEPGHGPDHSDVSHVWRTLKPTPRMHADASSSGSSDTSGEQPGPHEPEEDRDSPYLYPIFADALASGHVTEARELLVSTVASLAEFGLDRSIVMRPRIYDALARYDRRADLLDEPSARPLNEIGWDTLIHGVMLHDNVSYQVRLLDKIRRAYDESESSAESSAESDADETIVESVEHDARQQRKFLQWSFLRQAFRHARHHALDAYLLQAPKGSCSLLNFVTRVKTPDCFEVVLLHLDKFRAKTPFALRTLLGIRVDLSSDNVHLSPDWYVTYDKFPDAWADFLQRLADAGLVRPANPSVLILLHAQGSHELAHALGRTDLVRPTTARAAPAAASAATTATATTATEPVAVTVAPKLGPTVAKLVAKSMSPEMFRSLGQRLGRRRSKSSRGSVGKMRVLNIELFDKRVLNYAAEFGYLRLHHGRTQHHPDMARWILDILVADCFGRSDSATVRPDKRMVCAVLNTFTRIMVKLAMPCRASLGHREQLLHKHPAYNRDHKVLTPGSDAFRLAIEHPALRDYCAESWTFWFGQNDEWCPSVLASMLLAKVPISPSCVLNIVSTLCCSSPPAAPKVDWVDYLPEPDWKELARACAKEEITELQWLIRRLWELGRRPIRACA